MIRILASAAISLLFSLSASAQMPSAATRCWNAQRGYHPFAHATKRGVEINNTTTLPIADSCRISTGIENFSLSFRLANKAFRSMGKPNVRPCGFFLTHKKGRLWVTLEAEERSDLFSSSTVPKISLFCNGDSIPLAVSRHNAVSPHGDTNLWRLTVEGGTFSIWAGSHNLEEIITIPYTPDTFTSFGFVAAPGSKIMVSDIALEPAGPQAMQAPGKWADTAMLRDYLLQSSDPLEGYWTVFDRSLDETLLRLGGDYRLAIVKNGVNYEVVYLGGATVNAAKWLPGMTKAILRPDAFPGIYNLEWIDSEGNSLSHELKAQCGEGNTLSLQFPYQDSAVRLRKIPVAGN